MFSIKPLSINLSLHNCSISLFSSKQVNFILSLFFKNFRAISPVPVAISRISSLSCAFETIYIFSFQILCKPRDIASFIKSYLFETELNMPDTNLGFSFISTFFDPKFTLLSILTSFPFCI